MSYKSSPQENPVGPESPAFTFPFSKVQVLVALLLVAIGLTAWKLYEAKYIAPGTTVRWQPFSLEALTSAAHRRIDVLIVLDPNPPEELQSLNEQLTNSEFQKAVYLTRPRTFRIESMTSLDESSVAWLEEQSDKVSPGNLIWLPQGDVHNYRVFSASEIDQVIQCLTSAD